MFRLCRLCIRLVQLCLYNNATYFPPPPTTIEQERGRLYRGALYIFGGVLQYIQSMPRRCAMKDVKKKLIISVKEISGIDEALQVLKQMDSTVSV